MTDANWAFERYEAIRPRLPQPRPMGAPRVVDSLSQTTDLFDGYILDAFGVLNFGDTVIPGAVARMAELRAAGKRLVVLTNGASFPREIAVRKYAKFGFDFTPEEVVTSRDVLRDALRDQPADMLWAGISAPGAGYEDLPARIESLVDDPSLYERAEGFLFLGAGQWDDRAQARLVAALRENPRPVMVGNPDIVAPQEGGFSIEPGYYAHELPLWPQGPEPRFYGKPYLPALEAAIARLGISDRSRIAMVGDTLHTDVLGAHGAGIGSVLVGDHGLFRGLDPMIYVNRSGIVPQVLARTT